MHSYVICNCNLFDRLNLTPQLTDGPMVPPEPTELISLSHGDTTWNRLVPYTQSIRYFLEFS